MRGHWPSVWTSQTHQKSWSLNYSMNLRESSFTYQIPGHTAINWVHTSWLNCSHLSWKCSFIILSLPGLIFVAGTLWERKQSLFLTSLVLSKIMTWRSWAFTCFHFSCKFATRHRYPSLFFLKGPGKSVQPRLNWLRFELTGSQSWTSNTNFSFCILFL